MQGRKLLMRGGQWAVKRRGRCKRSTTVEKWMCRLRRNELYRLKFRKKFVKNGQEEIYAREGGGYPRAHACEYVSRRLQTTLYICRRREICLMTENREKRSVASRILLPLFRSSSPVLFFFSLFLFSFANRRDLAALFFGCFPGV